jgi:hypothetical protein
MMDGFMMALGVLMALGVAAIILSLSFIMWVAVLDWIVACPKVSSRRAIDERPIVPRRYSDNSRSAEDIHS